ncbi:lysosomal dipeptide transporter MFSD1-like [Clavelina lepadiformis]|uniref:lysosomal dipeptide transporter MFSD1-like n=1 Tax=Clavelina lepadiformis TaxID=159417 RepID=UPI0040432FB6
MQLYAWYSWPNVVLCFFGGFLLDRVFGVRLGSIIFSVFVLIGQLIYALGATVEKLWLMDVGRFIFGIGGESLAVAQNTYAVLWFKEKDLNLVFGLQLSMARIGSTVNMNLMVPVYDWVENTFSSDRTLGISLFLAAITCIFSLGCALLLAYLDRRAERMLGREKTGQEEVVKFTDVKDFPLQLWLIFLICVGYYVAVFPFIGLGKVLFEEKFGFSPTQSSAVNSIVYILSAPCSPVLGFLVDRLGYNISWVLIAVLTTLFSHGLLGFTFLNPWFAMCVMGVSYSLLACALWPMVSYVVPLHQLATAYGFMQSIQNLGLAVISQVSGLILDSSGYFMLEIFFCICVSAALIATLLLYFVDVVKSCDLNLSARKRKEKSDCESVVEASQEEEVAKEELCLPDPELRRPRTAFGIRNRYYSRIGAQIPEHLLAHTSLTRTRCHTV